MKLPMLVVDKNIEFSKREQAEWLKNGIPTVRVDTMQEAISKLTKDSFFVTAINADNVNYLPLLKIMSDISSSPIIIGTSNFKTQDQTKAIRLGANGYAGFEEPSVNVESALALLEQLDKWNRLPKKPPKIVTSGNLIIFYEHKQVFCNDKEILLTKKEYKIFHYLLINRNIKLLYKQIIRRVWEKELDSVSPNTVQQIIFRLRAKLDEAGFNGGIIESMIGEGYRFTPYPDK